MTTRDQAINEISHMCNTKYGSLLLQLMDVCDKYRLMDVTEEEAVKFVEDIRFGRIEPRHSVNTKATIFDIK